MRSAEERKRVYYSENLEYILEFHFKARIEMEEEEEKTNRNRETRTSSRSGSTHSLLNSLNDSHFDLGSRTTASVEFTARDLLRVVNWT